LRSNRVMFLVLLLAAVLVAGQFLLVQSLLASGALSSQIAIHWGFDGRPDGFSDTNAYSLGVTGAYIALLAMLGFFAFGIKRRLLKPLLFGVTAFVQFFIFGLITGTTLMQIGIPAEEAVIEPWILIALLAIPIGMVSLVLGAPKVSLGEDLRVQVRGITLLRLDYSELQSVELLELRARDFGGLGIRYARKTLAFVSTPGAGVLMSTTFGESVAVRSNNADILLAAIAAKIGE
jgi:hypothetical protein